MKESEAKTKWCPEVRIINFNYQLVTNRGEYVNGNFPATVECIGSDCGLMKMNPMDLNLPATAA